MKKLPILCIAAIALTNANDVKSNDYVTCSFNYTSTLCRISYDKKYHNVNITWRDGKQQKFYGELINNKILVDTNGNKWSYMDFDMGRAWSLKNTKNGDTIIWNGTFKEYGSYIGL